MVLLLIIKRVIIVQDYVNPAYRQIRKDIGMGSI